MKRKFVRKNISMLDQVFDRAEVLMHARAIGTFSELLSALIREEYERRGLGAREPIAEPPDAERHITDLKDAQKQLAGSGRSPTRKHPPQGQR